jgi:hypothetical protein
MLIEGNDAHHRTGDGRGDFPPDELFAKIVLPRHTDRDDRLPCFLQRGHRGVRCGVRCGVRRVFQPEIGEDAIVAVYGRCADGFAIDGNDPFSLLARGLGDEHRHPMQWERAAHHAGCTSPASSRCSNAVVRASAPDRYWLPALMLGESIRAGRPPCVPSSDEGREKAASPSSQPCCTARCL